MARSCMWMWCGPKPIHWAWPRSARNAGAGRSPGRSLITRSWEVGFACGQMPCDLVGMQGRRSRWAAAVGTLLVNLLLHARRYLHQHTVQAQLLTAALLQVPPTSCTGLRHQLAEQLHRSIHRAAPRLAARTCRHRPARNRAAGAATGLANALQRLTGLSFCACCNCANSACNPHAHRLLPCVAAVVPAPWRG